MVDWKAEAFLDNHRFGIMQQMLWVSAPSGSLVPRRHGNEAENVVRVLLV